MNYVKSQQDWDDKITIWSSVKKQLSCNIRQCGHVLLKLQHMHDTRHWDTTTCCIPIVLCNHNSCPHLAGLTAFTYVNEFHKTSHILPCNKIHSTPSNTLHSITSTCSIFIIVGDVCHVKLISTYVPVYVLVQKVVRLLKKYQTKPVPVKGELLFIQQPPSPHTYVHDTYTFICSSGKIHCCFFPYILCRKLLTYLLSTERIVYLPPSMKRAVHWRNKLPRHCRIGLRSWIRASMCFRSGSW